MAIRPVWKLLRVERSPYGAGEPDSLLRSRHDREQAATKRSLRQIGSVVRPPAAQLSNRLPQIERGAVRPALIVGNDGSDVGVVREARGSLRSHEDVNRATLCELPDERRREYDVAKKARLNNERPAHSVSTEPTCIPPNPPEGLQGRLPGVSPLNRPASFSSFLPSASRAAFACVRCLRRSTWRARPSAVASRSCAR